MLVFLNKKKLTEQNLNIAMTEEVKKYCSQNGQTWGTLPTEN
jgi:hypothetical protein